MPQTFSPALPDLAMLDANVRHKMIDLPAIIGDWMGPFTDLAGKRILDFGCGFGEMAAGVALIHDPAQVVGIDIGRGPIKGLERLRAILGEHGIPPNLKLEQVEEGRLGSLKQVDVILSWSAIEHVARQALPDILKGLHDLLVPGGLMMLQISPLYFSPAGAHLWPCDYGPWEHLEKTSSEVVADINACEDLNERQRASVTAMFLELNRLTAPELLDMVEDVGFTVLRKQIDRTHKTPPPTLLNAYTAEALTTEQIVILLRKAG